MYYIMLSAFATSWVVLLSLTAAAPSPSNATMEKRGFDCNAPAPGLTKEDCEYMSSIGMAGQGLNAQSPNGIMWIGNQGPFTLTFTNKLNEPVVVIAWHFKQGDYEAHCLNKRQSQISYSLPKQGDKVTVSVEDRTSGSWSALVGRKTKLAMFGGIENTWGEFTTGTPSVVDISRLINMSGGAMSARTKTCTTDMNRCVFVCKAGNTCMEGKDVTLKDCQPGSQPGAEFGKGYAGTDEGGCKGWDRGDGGHVEVSIG